MKWNNRSYRPGNYGITPQKKVVDINELLKPYNGSNKGGVWIPQQIVANVYKEPEVPIPDVTPSPTPTNTLTPSPTPTPASYPVIFVSSGATFDDLCSNPQPIITLYSPQPFYTNEQQLYYDSALTQFIDWSVDANVFFASTGGTQLYFYGPATFGLSTYGFTCASPTPTPTESGTPTPTPTNTLTATPTGTGTPTPTPTNTLTATPTQTGTPTPTPSPLPPDSGATAYLNAVVTAGGTVNSTMSAATYTFYSTIRSAGILDKLYRMYPYIGGTSAAHAVEGISPSVNSGTFNGGWTHSVSGATPNGTNGYMTQSPTIAPSIISTFGFGVYVNQTAGNQTPIGSYSDAGGGIQGYAAISLVDSTAQIAMGSNDTLSAAALTARTITQGYYAVSRLSDTQIVQKQNTGTTLVTINKTLDTQPQYIGGRSDNGAPADFFNKRIAFVFQGRDLSSAELDTLYSAVQTYQTSLGRQV